MSHVTRGLPNRRGGRASGAAIRGVRWFGDDPALARRDTGMRARAGPTHLSKKWVRDEAVLKPACFLNLLHRIYDRGRCRVPEWGRARAKCQGFAPFAVLSLRMIA